MKILLLMCSILSVLGEPSATQKPDSHNDEQRDTARRESCAACDLNVHRCKSVSKVFQRKTLTHGYHVMTSIPAGACNISITAKGNTENHVALRWTTTKAYFMNGDWVTDQSGNYTAEGNDYSYITPNFFNKEDTFGDQIRFTTKLSHSIDVCLVYQSKNRGVIIQYVMPPLATAGDNTVKTAAGEELSTTPSMQNNGESAIKDLNAGKTNEQINKQQFISPMQEDQIKAKYGIVRENDAAAKTRPGWVNDLKFMLKVWKAEFDTYKADIKNMKTDLAQTKTDLAQTKIDVARNVAELKRRLDNIGVDQVKKDLEKVTDNVAQVKKWAKTVTSCEIHEVPKKEGCKTIKFHRTYNFPPTVAAVDVVHSLWFYKLVAQDATKALEIVQYELNISTLDKDKVVINCERANQLHTGMIATKAKLLVCGEWTHSD